jgi:hypothetical protein
VELVEQYALAALLISVTIPANLASAQDLIRRIRPACAHQGTKIIVGGQAFETDPQLPAAIGADQHFAAVRDAVDFVAAHAQR